MKSAVEWTNKEERLKILVERAPVGVCIIQDGKFRLINSYFSATTGYTLDELVGKDSFAVVFPEDREAARENRASTIRAVEGGAISCLQLARDVTKRKQMEEIL